MNYPIIIIPNSFLEVLKTTPHMESPEQPLKPEKIKKGIDFFIFFSIAIFCFSLDNQYFIGCFISIFILILRLYYNVKLKKKKLEIYKENIQKYFEKLEKYKTHLINLEYINSFQQNMLRKLIRETPTFSNNSSTIITNKKGRYENFFFNYLNQFFLNRIKVNTCFGYSNSPYEPDFVFFDEETNLHIDIEIDEPYIYSSKEPIHYIGVDDNRNNYFVSNNWIVIRFAEEQIVKTPIECCKVIAGVISTILKDDIYLKPLSHVKDLDSIPQWSFDKASLLAKSDFRESYKILD